MRLDKNELIAGVPVRAVRDFLRRLRSGHWSKEAIEEDLRLPPDHADALIKELVARGLLEAETHRGLGPAIWYKSGPAADRFVMVRFLKPISKEKARKVLDGFLERVRALNANDEFLYVVKRAWVFGSYIDKSMVDCADVDVAFEVVPRVPMSRAQLVDASLERARASGKQHPNFLAKLFFAEFEVRSFLKGRDRYLSLHDKDDLDAIGARRNQVFPT